MFFIAVLLLEIFFPLEVYFWPGELRGLCGPEKKFSKFEVCGINFNRNLRNLRLFLASELRRPRRHEKSPRNSKSSESISIKIRKIRGMNFDKPMNFDRNPQIRVQWNEFSTTSTI